MTTQFWIENKKLRWLKNLIIRCDGRFLGNPILCGNRSYISLSFSDMDKANEFHTMLSIIKQSFF